jgi:uncharacterized membrane protein
MCAALAPMACSTPDANCPSPPQSCPATPPSYSAEVSGILQAHCVLCHKAGGPGASWPLGTYDGVQAIRLEVESQVAACVMPLPDGGVALTSEERNTLLTWLVCGAPRN